MKRTVTLLAFTLLCEILYCQTDISALYMQLQRGKTNELIEILSPMVKDSSLQDSEIIALLGDAYKGQNDYAKALDCYNRILLYDTENRRALESTAEMYTILGELSKAVANLEILYGLDSNNLRVANKLASIYQSGTNYRNAINIYRKLYTKNVNSYNTAKILGDCYWLIENSDSSLYFYHRADYLNGKSTVTKLTLSQILYIQKDFNSAKIFASRGVELDSSNIQLRRQLGNCHYKLEEYKEALPHFNYLTAHKDSSATLLRKIGAIHYFLGMSDTAIPYLRLSISKDSLNSETHYYLAASLNQIGKREEALSAFQTALLLMQPDPQVVYMIQNQMGIALGALKRYEESYDSFRQAYEYNPNDLKLIYQMAMAKGEQKGEKNLKEAQVLLERYLKALDEKGTTPDKDEIYLKYRSEWFLGRIKEELFMMEKR